MLLKQEVRDRELNFHFPHILNKFFCFEQESFQNNNSLRDQIVLNSSIVQELVPTQ